MSPYLKDVLAELRRARGIDLSGYRPGMLERRLRARMIQSGISDETVYLDRLRGDPTEPLLLLESISINVSAFFRNPATWENISQWVLPAILEHKRRHGQQELRIWSAGCAAGEEAYSIAMLVHAALQEELPEWTIHVFGTDISEEALRAALRGVYPRDRIESVRLGMLDRYFTQVHENDYQVQSFIRKMVWFSRDDLASTGRIAPADSVFGSFDLILCRNVFIYFSRDLQKQVVGKLLRALAPQGYLVMGEAELLGEGLADGLTAVDRRNRVYRKTAGDRTDGLPKGK